MDKDSYDFSDIGVTKAVDIPIRGFLSTGSLSLDWAVSGKLEGGGFPMGRVVELYGDPSTGKSLIVAHLIANAQKLGWYTFLDDSENALEKFFAQRVGVNIDKLDYANSETIEGHFRRVSLVVRRIRESDDKRPILICLDSLAALSTTHERGSPEIVVSKEEDEKLMPELNLEKRDMFKAQLVRAGLRVLGTRFMKDDVIYVVANHTTAQIGQSYGPKTTTPGGGGIKFHASVRIDLSRGKLFQSDMGPTGHEVTALVTKNKVAPPFKKALFSMYFDSGVQKYSGFLDILAKAGYVSEGGGWWRITGNEEKKYRKEELENEIPNILAKIKAGEADAKEVK